MGQLFVLTISLSPYWLPLLETPLAAYGHSGTDHALSFDVITGNGEYVRANTDSSPDLFWALQGGGPSTFAVVLAATFKTIPEARTTRVLLNINNSTMTNDVDLFWEGAKIFHSHANSLVDNELYGYFEIVPRRPCYQQQRHPLKITELGKRPSCSSKRRTRGSVIPDETQQQQQHLDQSPLLQLVLIPKYEPRPLVADNEKGRRIRPARVLAPAIAIDDLSIPQLTTSSLTLADDDQTLAR
ncbi:hypothetical protein PG993_014178 [Apiospora rasikravindrae]|uniref:Berberine/berberine-like domain-containing protein n=1 Tax=Apiospora rasikravindrae TaxID=990691 RepID=A0ABR1RSI8_9PEZI